MNAAAGTNTKQRPLRVVVRAARGDHGELARAGNYPLSRWYLRPLAGLLAAWLANTGIRPWHITLAGFALAVAAGVAIVANPALLSVAAWLVLGWWFCDRTDGQLARLQDTASPLGAWLDGNLDELVDLGLHAAMAHVAAAQGAPHAWPLLLAFYFGKYLLMHGLTDSPQVVHSLGELTAAGGAMRCEQNVVRGPRQDRGFRQARRLAKRVDYFRQLYHLPGNADVRAHLTVLALATGWISTELAVLAVYYNLRWMARYPLLFARARRPAA